MTQRSLRTNLQRIGGALYPSGINAYYRCPRKFHYRFFAKPRLPYQFKPYLALGGAVHKVIAHQLSARVNGTDPGDVRSLAEDYLSREAKMAEDPKVWVRSQLDDVERHVQAGLAYVPEQCEILAVERVFTRAITTARLGESVQLKSRVDLVLRHTDGVVEHIDFKTGKKTGDLFQNVLTRIVVASELEARGESLRTTNFMTSTAAAQHMPTDMEANRPVWTTIRETIEQIARDTEWESRPEPAVCRWCEYNLICEHAELGETDDSVDFDA